jgi:hypothetical protein
VHLPEAFPRGREHGRQWQPENGGVLCRADSGGALRIVGLAVW